MDDKLDVEKLFFINFIYLPSLPRSYSLNEKLQASAGVSG